MPVNAAVSRVLRAALEAPVDTARRMVALAALLKAGVLAPVLFELGNPDVLRIPVIDWMPVLSSGVLRSLLVVWIVTAAAFLAGWRTRATGLVLTAVLFLVALGDAQLYSNHLYLLGTLVGLLTAAEARWVARPILLLRLQTSIVYGFAAITKLNLLYVSGGVFRSVLGTDSLLPFPESLRTVHVLAPLAMVSIIVELLLATGFWLPRWRVATALLGVVFHLGIILFMLTPLDLTVFALLMFALYVLHLAQAVD